MRLKYQQQDYLSIEKFNNVELPILYKHLPQTLTEATKQVTRTPRRYYERSE